MRTIRNSVPAVIVVMMLACSGNDYAPRPKGYPRMALPEKSYQIFKSTCPFIFDYSAHARISAAQNTHQPCWLNLDYPFLRSRIHLSYKEIDGNLAEYLEDSRTLVYKHTVKADAINEFNYADSTHRIFAKIYKLSGNAASSVQFYATDSTRHFLRGALYFNAKANADSLEPAIRYISEDIEYLISSLRWTEPTR